jgi:hypothetical protein
MARRTGGEEYLMKRQSKLETWIWLIVLLLLFLTISYFSLSPKPQAYPSYVTDSPSPTGVKAIYTYLKKEMDVSIWAKSPELLPKNGEKKLLIMVEPSLQLKEEEMQKYVSFMEEGNTILLLAENPEGMFELKTQSNKNDVAYNIYDKEKRVVKALVDSRYRLEPDKQDQILLDDHLGTIALKRSYGKGNLIVSVSPEWMTNEKILKFDHLPLVLSFINEGKTNAILFDEYIHGKQSTSALLLVYPKWFLLLLLQGILLTIIWVWHKGKRFGPIYIPREESVRFSDEGIQAVAAWYTRGKRYHDSLLIQADYVKLLLQERWQIPYSKEWQDLASYFEKKWIHMPSSEIKPFLSGLVTILKKEKLSKQEYLLWSRKLEQLRKEVEA